MSFFTDINICENKICDCKEKQEVNPVYLNGFNKDTEWWCDECIKKYNPNRKKLKITIK